MSVLMTDKVSVRGPAHFFQGDNRTQLVWFTVNRYRDGIDLAQLTWSIHIRNAEGVTDVAMPCENPDIRGDKIIIGWLVRGIATAAVGDLTFNLRGVAEDAEGNPIIWNSGDEKRPVYSSLTCTPSEEQETALSELDALIKYVGQELPELLEDVRKVPIIGENGNWWLWDFDLGKYVDSGKPSRGEGGGGGGTSVGIATPETLGIVRVGKNLAIDTSGALSVVTADRVEQGNTHPITSAAVHATVGNIEILLGTI